MTIFTHVVVGTNDVAKATAFYDAVLGALDIKRLPVPGTHFLMYGNERPELMVVSPANGQPATAANGGTIGLKAPSRAAVDAFHASALANGGSCEGPPGPRELAGPDSYGAYIRDPDGNKLCTFSAE